MENSERFLLLLDKYTSNTIDIIEHDELFTLLSSGQFDELWHSHFQHHQQRENLPGTDIAPERAQEILWKILNSEQQTSQIIPKSSYTPNRWIWASAAMVAGLVVLVYWWMQSGNAENKTVFAENFTKNMIEKVNHSDHPVRIEMEDSSFLTLQPGSKINFPRHFLADKREVYMTGEVFFEISKQHSRPFFVYNNNIVTQVLGTKFNVKMDLEKKLVEVAVVSGRVQVSENSKTVNSGDKKVKAVILLPNQRVIYKEEEQQFNTLLVTNPLPVEEEMAKKVLSPQIFVFDDTPLSKVLETIEKTYKIEIIAQNDAIYNCLFTGDLNKYELYTKLDVICQSVKASYEINGTKILIKGQGCN
ncbi:MAG: FecR family protein [Bacteroidota bacterium]